MLSVFWRQDFVLCASWGLYKGRGLGPLRPGEFLGQIFFEERWEPSFVTLYCKKNAFGNKRDEQLFCYIPSQGVVERKISVLLSSAVWLKEQKIEALVKFLDILLPLSWTCKLP